MRNREIVDNKSRSEWLYLIREWVHNADDRQMLEMFLLDGLSVESVAEKLNLSSRWTQQRIAKAKKQLFNHIK